MKKLARIEASSICRQQLVNVFADCFCAVHTHQLEFTNTSLPTLVCRVKAALESLGRDETPRQASHKFFFDMELRLIIFSIHLSRRELKVCIASAYCFGRVIFTYGPFFKLFIPRVNYYYGNITLAGFAIILLQKCPLLTIHLLFFPRYFYIIIRYFRVTLIFLANRVATIGNKEHVMTILKMVS